MHALGFYHEQNRPDRDENVHVFFNNVNSSMCFNFAKCSALGGSTCKTFAPYNYKSIM